MCEWRGIFYCEPLNFDPTVQNTSRGWGISAGRCPGARRWLHWRKEENLAGVREENTRKLGFRREEFREQERTLANSPGGYRSARRPRERRATQTAGVPTCTGSAIISAGQRLVERLGRSLRSSLPCLSARQPVVGYFHAPDGEGHGSGCI